jgi:hypothetical protein
MKVLGFQRTTTPTTTRVSAQIVWEDCDRPRQEIYYEVANGFADALSTSPDAFVVAASIPALKHGERRLTVEGAAMCPELRQGLETAMQWLHSWRGAERMPLPIDANVHTYAAPRPPDRAACFFTGGVDSMATLRHNRLRFAPEHPGSLKDGIIIYGLEVNREAAFESVLGALSAVADDAGITLLPVYSNVRQLDEDWTFWEFEWEGAVYASVAHALSRRFTTVSISSTYDIPNMHALGSHPLLDPNYGSTHLRIQHDGLTMSRLAKLSLLAGWPAGLNALRVCNVVDRYRPRTINCGECEKCVRTRLGLAALGVEADTAAFGPVELRAETVMQVGGISPHIEPFYRELVSPLIGQGRQDLAACVQQLVNRCRGEVGLVGSVRRFDRRVLGGRLRLLKHLLLPAIGLIE